MCKQSLDEKLFQLNKEYLQLYYNPEVQNILWKDEKKKSWEKIKRLIQVGYFLGYKVLIDFIQTEKKKKIYSTENYEVLDNIHKSYKVIIYTSVFGNIDNILEPLFDDINIEYFIITDQTLRKNSLWKKYTGEAVKELDGLTNQLKNRFCKLFPNKFFPEYEYSIYVDGNILIVSDLRFMISKIYSQTMGAFLHPKRNDIYTEAAAVLYLKNASPKSIKRQMKKYKEEGFPNKFGLFENSLIVRKHNDATCIQLMEFWWNQLLTYTQRDQLSLMYSLWKLNLPSSYIFSLGGNIDACPAIRRIKHINKNYNIRKLEL